MRGGAQPRDDACDRRANHEAVVEKWERKVEAVRLLPHRYPLVAGLPQQAPGAGREGLARQFRQRLRAAEPATCPADE